MSIFAPAVKPYYSVPDGTYKAILFQIIQLGSQGFEKNGKEWYSPQILLGFEIPELKYDTQNREVSSVKSGTYFLSMNESRNGVLGLREIVNGMTGKSDYTEEELAALDITKLLGLGCMITLSGVESKGKIYQNIVAVSQLEKGADKLTAMRKKVLVETDDFGNIDFLNLPAWISDKIKMSKEYKEMFEQDVTGTVAAPVESGESAEEMLKNVPF